MTSPLPPGAESQFETQLEHTVEVEAEALAVPREGEPSDAQPQADAPIAYRAVRGGLWLAASSYWSIGFGFIANILLTRLLTPQIYGEYALAVYFAMLFTLRTKVGLNVAYAQERSVNGTAVGTMFTLDVLLGIGGVLIGVIAAPILLYFGYSQAVVAMMLALLLVALGDSVYSVFMATLEKDLIFKPGSIIGSIILPLSYIPAFWFAWTGRGNLSLIGQSIAFSLFSYLFFGVFFWLRMRWMFALKWRFSRGLARRYFQFGALTGIAGFISSMVGQSDNFIVGTRAGAEQLGYYDRGYRTAQWPNLLLNSLLARSALFTYAQVKDDAARLRKTFSMVAWLTVAMGAPIALALMITGPDLIPLVYGERWLPAVPILRVLVAAAMLRPIWDNTFSFFVGYGQPQRAIWIGAVQLGVLFALGWVLVGYFGSVGVGFAVIVAYLVALALAYWITRDLLRLDLMDLFGWPLVAALLTVGGYMLLVRVLPLQSWPLLVRVLFGGVYAVVGFYAIGFLLQPRATRERIEYILRLLRRREA